MQVSRATFWESLISVALTLVAAVPFSGRGQASLVDGSFLVGAGACDEGGYGAVHSIVLQTNGGLLVGGQFNTIAGNACSNLARLGSDGSYDPAFVGGTDRPIYRMLQQPDGRILVAGSFTNLQGMVRYRIGRLLPGGEMDPEFDAGSSLETQEPAIALGLQPDGKVLVATTAVPHGRLFRLHANGDLDDSFVQTNLFRNWHIFAVHVRTNGSILVGGGFSAAGGHDSPALALLEPDGRPDTNFNSKLQNLSTVFTIQEQPNGRLLVGGIFKRLGSTNNIAIARMRANLEWDDSFSTDAVEHPGGFPLVREIVEQPDGKLVVTGNFVTVGGYWRRNVARLDTQGHVDGCFDPGLGLNDQLTMGGVTLGRQNDGRILVGGYFNSVDGRPLCNIARLLPASGCNAIRVHMGTTTGGEFYVAGTGPPGGSMAIQSSTNLVHWSDLVLLGWPDYDATSGSYLIRQFVAPPEPPIYFRVKKSYDFPDP